MPTPEQAAKARQEQILREKAARDRAALLARLQREAAAIRAEKARAKKKPGG